jgi:outer membrane protein TolC
MKTRTFFFIALTGSILLIYLPGLGAQETVALTWDQCVKEAALNNKDILTAEQTVKADEDAHVASLGQFFPQISFSAAINRSGPGGLSNAINDFSDSPPGTQNTSFSLNAKQDIFSGFTDFASVDQSNAQLDLARAQLKQAKAQLSHDLKVDFYTLLYTQQEITLLQSITERDQANADLVQMNFDGGTDNKGSLLQAQVAVEQDKLNVMEAQRELRVAQKNLDQVLGRNPMGDVVVQGEFDTPTLPDSLPNFVELTNQTPAHLEAVDQVRLSESSYVTARGAFLPTLSATASLGQSDGWNFGDTTQSGWTAGLSLSMPLFTGGKDLFTLKSAEESKKGEEDTLQSTDLKTESQLESDWASYVNAVDQIKVQEFQVKAAQVQEEIGKTEYLNGLLIFVNWNQLETALTNQQKNELSDQLNVKSTEATWALDQGKGDVP